jgi:hypothetical protein
MSVHQLTLFICFASSILCTSCNSLSPEKTFEIAVLNSNMIVGFASDRLSRELESPSVKLVENNKTETMKRSEVIKSKIDFSEEVLGKLKGMKQTDDTKEMLNASVAVYEYILPVYKTEYQQLAKLFDENASEENIRAQTQAIHDKYYQQFDQHYNNLINIGKSFAQRHNIRVNWAE